MPRYGATSRRTSAARRRQGPLEIEHQLDLRARAAEERAEVEPRAPGGYDTITVPEDRQRPPGLQVPDFGAIVMEPDVRLDDHARPHDGRQPVPGPMRDDEGLLHHRCPRSAGSVDSPLLEADAHLSLDATHPRRG